MIMKFTPLLRSDAFGLHEAAGYLESWVHGTMKLAQLIDTSASLGIHASLCFQSFCDLLLLPQGAFKKFLFQPQPIFLPGVDWVTCFEPQIHFQLPIQQHHGLCARTVCSCLPLHFLILAMLFLKG